MAFRAAVLCVPTVLVFVGACTKYRDDLDYQYAVEQTWEVDGLHFGEVVQFQSVPWNIDETLSLRRLIVDKEIAAGRRVLDLGTGTGLIAILCQQNGATAVVAVDRHEAAVANARYNAALLAAEDDLEVRLVDREERGAFAAVGEEEQFDLIIAHPRSSVLNPEYIQSVLNGMAKHVAVGGRCLFVCKRRVMIESLTEQAEQRGFEVKLLDERDASTLPEEFLPGVVVEVRPTRDS